MLTEELSLSSPRIIYCFLFLKLETLRWKIRIEWWRIQGLPQIGRIGTHSRGLIIDNSISGVEKGWLFKRALSMTFTELNAKFAGHFILQYIFDLKDTELSFSLISTEAKNSELHKYCQNMAFYEQLLSLVLQCRDPISMNK